MVEKQLLNIKEVCEYLGIGQTKARELVRGNNEFGVQIGNRWYANRKKLDAFNEVATDNMRSDCKALLVDILNRAVEADLLVKNIAVGINTVIDNEEKEEKRILTDEEIKILLDTSKGGQLYSFFVVGLGTGMRLGEILGLTWDCVDFDNGVIHVQKTLCYLPNGGGGFI